VAGASGTLFTGTLIVLTLHISERLDGPDGAICWVKLEGFPESPLLLSAKGLGAEHQAHVRSAPKMEGRAAATTIGIDTDGV
jgi:hypothetical protein